MVHRTDFIRRRREEAWAYGRKIRDSFLAAYKMRYGLEIAPPPALIVDELLTDFLDAELKYDPLGDDVFAQTEWADGRPLVTVNSLTGSIPGVRDAQGVQNVAKWHEAIHVADHVDILRSQSQLALSGFDAPEKIVCYRSDERLTTTEARAREFWAEEAGRAAAVSFQALASSQAFRELCALAGRSRGPVARAFPLLYTAASDIGVNITALVKQLTLEGRIAVTEERGRKLVYVQPALTHLPEVT